MSHPDRAFAWDDAAAMRAFVARRAFATVVAAIEGRPLLAHAPLALESGGGPRFHLSRRNALTPLLAGQPVVASVLGEDFYVSPDWYGAPDQVPTWNYRLVEIAGTARRLDEPELRAQADAISAAQEALIPGKAPWHSRKMRPAALDAMIRGVVGFAIEDAVWTGTVKMSQNKPAAMVGGAAAALRALGHEAAAAAIEAAR